MKYTRKRDVIEITIFITIIVFFIITAFFESSANKSLAKKLSQEYKSDDFQNIILSNSASNSINNNSNPNSNSTQNNTANNIENSIVNNIINNTVSNRNTSVSSTSSNESKKSNKIKDKSNKWRIEIPKIGLNAPIKEGTTQEVMLEAVGHFTETPKDTGNVGLAAHNRGYECNFFERIKELNKGDKIIYKTANKTRTYLVETNTVIKQTNWNYLEPTKDNRITLITCEKDRKEYRRCIQAIEVK